MLLVSGRDAMVRLGMARRIAGPDRWHANWDKGSGKRERLINIDLDGISAWQRRSGPEMMHRMGIEAGEAFSRSLGNMDVVRIRGGENLARA